MSKPYGPIRRWLDKIGLISSRPSDEQIPTAELPKPEFEPEPEPQPEPQPDAEPELLTERELESSTADTRPLPAEVVPTQFTAEPKTDEQVMESKGRQTGNRASEMNQKNSGPLLDLGDLEPAHAAAEGDFVLDLDFDVMPAAAPAPPSFPSRGATDRSDEADDRQQEDKEFLMAEVVEAEVQSAPTTVVERAEPTVDPMAETQELVRPVIGSAATAGRERVFTEPQILEGETLHGPRPVADAGQITLEQLSPEAIDAIARRAVEMLSEKVVQEIAWEVVPQLAELLIKRQLEEKNS